VRLCVLGSIAVAACGGAQSQADRERQRFECNDRMAGYVATQTLGAAEMGVAISCDQGPRLVRWRVTTDGTRAEETRNLTPGEFDKLWYKVDASGWRDLKSCAGDGGDDDPIFKFSFKDWTGDAQFECQTRKPPFPYNTILDELDLAAAWGRKQLGPDEGPPADEAVGGMR
jgi:hypothetical protein